MPAFHRNGFKNRASAVGTKSPFNFNIDLRIGAGAFVCGEETALISSVEGKRGTPRPRPPFPAESGLWNCPTLINNVETFANIAPIIRKGAQWFAGIGTEKSKGTMVFALAGQVANTGLVEVPMGTALRRIVEGMGGGAPDGRKIKAVQTGGPSGGYIPAEALDTPVDYESLSKLGSIMGSGGMIVMDDSTKMVDVARSFMEFCVDGASPSSRWTARAVRWAGRFPRGRPAKDGRSALVNRPQLSPSPAGKPKYHPQRENAQHGVDTKLQVEKSSEQGAGQYWRPHPEFLQRVNKITGLQHFLENWVDERNHD